MENYTDFILPTDIELRDFLHINKLQNLSQYQLGEIKELLITLEFEIRNSIKIYNESLKKPHINQYKKLLLVNLRNLEIHIAASFLSISHIIAMDYYVIISPKKIILFFLKYSKLKEVPFIFELIYKFIPIDLT